jgi:hypothetical protein
MITQVDMNLLKYFRFDTFDLFLSVKKFFLLKKIIVLQNKYHFNRIINVCILQILTFCTIISLLNGCNGQGFESKTSNEPQSDGMYVFNLPPLQISPLQINLGPSQSSLFLVRQNDESQEFVPIEEYRPKNFPIALELEDNQTQILSVNTVLPKPTPQPLPKVTTQAVSQNSTKKSSRVIKKN